MISYRFISYQTINYKLITLNRKVDRPSTIPIRPLSSSSSRNTHVPTDLPSLNPSVFYFLLVHFHEIPLPQTKRPWLQNELRPNPPPLAAKGRQGRKHKWLGPKARDPTHNGAAAANRSKPTKHYTPVTKGNDRSLKKVLRFEKRPPLIDLRSQPTASPTISYSLCKSDRNPG